MPAWLLWILRVMVVGVFGLLFYFMVTAPRRGTRISAEFQPGRDQFFMPDGTGARLSSPWSTGPPGMTSGPGQGFSTKFWPGQGDDDGPLDLTIRARTGPWTGMALELTGQEGEQQGPEGSRDR